MDTTEILRRALELKMKWKRPMEWPSHVLETLKGEEITGKKEKRKDWKLYTETWC